MWVPFRALAATRALARGYLVTHIRTVIRILLLSSTKKPSSRDVAIEPFPSSFCVSDGIGDGVGYLLVWKFSVMSVEF